VKPVIVVLVFLCVSSPSCAIREIQPHESAFRSGRGRDNGRNGPETVGRSAQNLDDNTASQSDFRKRDRECDLGDESSCSLIAHAFETGELLAASNERPGRDKRKAAEYHQKACTYGSGFSCLKLGAMYEKGDGVEKDLSRAAAMYSKACEGIDTAAPFGCFDLAEFYLEGKGVTEDQKLGLQLLARSCASGLAPACGKRAIYAGTGLQSNRPAPQGAMGFAFRSTRGEAAAECARMNGTWSNIDANNASCKMLVGGIDLLGTVVVSFAKDRTSWLNGFAAVEPQKLWIEFTRIDKVLRDAYGDPTSRRIDVPSSCSDNVLPCLSEKAAEIEEYWEFKDSSSVTLNVTTHAGFLVIGVVYLSQDATKLARIQGL
jgi:hypothetical protein